MLISSFLSKQGVISHLIINSKNQIILIDPSFDLAQKIALEIQQKNLQLKYILETHTHADFFSSRKLFKALYPKSLIGLSQFSPTKDNQLKLKDNQVLELENLKLTVWEGHGHTNESLIFVLKDGDQTSIFTGDALLIGGTGRTDFQLGESKALYRTLTRILTLPETTIIYPGHNYQGQTRTTLGVEKLTNPRLKLVLEGKQKEFIELMKNHKPPQPELFEESLRWNSL
jgi:sulfur dioxygenase